MKITKIAKEDWWIREIKSKFGKYLSTSDEGFNSSELGLILLIQEVVDETRKQDVEKIRGLEKDDKYGMDVENFKGTIVARRFSRAYNSALEDAINIISPNSK